jgi:hypothetical protein
MKVSSFFPDSLGSATRSALFALSLTAVLSFAAQAQTIAPHADFQESTLTSSTNAITATRVPVADSTGAIHYRNITLLFDVADSSTDGVSVTLASGYPTVVTSASPILVNGFVAGTYAAPNGAKIVVSGPGIASGGATEWSLAQSGTTCAFPFSATWYVGPITSNPLYTRLKKAGITSTAYSYGLLGTNSTCGGNDWDGGNILGFSQTGTTLTILSFSFAQEDSSTPIAQLTYSLVN